MIDGYYSSYRRFLLPCMNAKCNASGLVGSYLLDSNVVLNHVLGKLFYSVINRLFFCIFSVFTCIKLIDFLPACET